MHMRKWLIGVMLTTLGLLAWVGSLHAQVGYDLSWFGVDSGGVIGSADGYTLRSTVGQANAGQLSTGDYTLTGGVLAAVEAAPPTLESSSLFLPHLNR